jgi:oxepin-CoA hydrolase/3-oxo-5,6-dehydrosuberyl-CoA semialdehyde dehydrogenase
MVTLKSYVRERWQAGNAAPAVLTHAVTGEPIAQCNSDGVDFRAMVEHARTVGGPALRALSFHQRADLLKKMAGVLNENLPEFYQIAATYGATKADAWIDIEGGIGNLFVYASLGRKELPDSPFALDGDAIGLSKEGTFGGRHVYVPLEGVAVQINAYNFPAWGMLEKLAPALLAVMPTIVKPATASAWLAFRMIEILVNGGIMPPGTLQLIVGSAGDLLDHLGSQDIVAFTGSAETGANVRSHPNLVRRNVRVNIEADSIRERGGEGDDSQGRTEVHGRPPHPRAGPA